MLCYQINELYIHTQKLAFHLQHNLMNMKLFKTHKYKHSHKLVLNQ